MTIDEAIDLLRAIYDDRAFDLSSDMPGQKAIQLGIEALELKKKLMHLIAMGQSTEITDLLILKPLPSETEED